jgi:glyoxylase-like metal-dependent hydrolase (beta-lactamase superfamily II)
MKKLVVMTFAAVFIIASTFVLQAQAPRGEPGQRRGGGQREGGQRDAGRGGDARGGGQRAGAQPQQQPMAIKMVKPGLYMVTGGGGNSTVRVTDQGVILVDTKNLGDQFYNELMGQIKTVTNQPVKYAFVTHVHQDHSGNIGKFVQAGVQVITNDGLKRNLETGGADGKGYTSAAGKPSPPNVTYTKNKKIKLGNARAEAYHFGRAHTGGDTVVYFPDLKVVSLGDEFVAAQPNADYPMGGSLLEWSKVLSQVLKLDFDTAIPGHGNDPLTKADVMAFQKKIDMIGKKAVELAKKGTPKDQIRAQVQSQTPDIGNWQMTGVINDQRLDAFYDEVSKAK